MERYTHTTIRFTPSSNSCHCLGRNKTVASFKRNYPVSLSRDRHIFRSREHETRVPLSRCETTCPAINPDSTPSGCSVQELVRRAWTILSCDRTFDVMTLVFLPPLPIRCFLLTQRSRLCRSREREREKGKEKEKTETTFFIRFSTVLRRESWTRLVPFIDEGMDDKSEWKEFPRKAVTVTLFFILFSPWDPYPSPLISMIRHIFLFSLSMTQVQIYK